jgi:hypothetical protein
MAASVKPGLGTSLIEALSALLHGVIKVEEADPETMVSVAYTQHGVVAHDALAADRAV